MQASIDAGRAHEDGLSRNRLQTVTLLDALAEHGFDAAFGGARRDEERARAKERVLSFRDELGQWEPRNQRPEIWDVFNTVVRRGESVRAFPISNWTELDVWRYIEAEDLEVPSIYFAHEREVFERDGMLFAVSEFLRPATRPSSTRVRYRTVGDLTVTGAVRSEATDITAIIEETLASRTTERGADARRRPHVVRRDGGPQARGLLLVSDLLRIATAGSVDDGKSTLIGRLLLDSKQLLDDQHETDLAHVTDGLRAEREQGITIDVAYRFFATPRRTFIIADTPGHERYTRNMVTGASTADLALILVDVRKGLLEQSRRHAYLSALLGIRHLVACVNKMDLVDFDEAPLPGDRARLPRARRAARDRRRARDPDLARWTATTSSTTSSRTPWYDGPPLLELLETIEVARDRNLDDVRFPVQWVIRDGDFRGYAGRVAGGVLRPATRSSSSRTARARGSPRSTRPTARSSARSRRWWRRSRSRTSSTSAAAISSPRRGRAAGGARARGDGVLDGRDPGPDRRPLPAQAHDPARARDARGDQRPDRHRQLRRGARGGARAQRHRADPAAHERAGRRRPVRRPTARPARSS